MPVTKVSRTLPVGAELQPGGGAHFRLWAPKARRIELVLDGGHSHPLEPAADGYFELELPSARAGALYRFRVDGSDSLVPDPASRFQPEGPHGPSMIIDPRAFRWTDAAWPGIDLRGQAIYEMHVGTFTREGAWQAAMRELPELRRAGITVLEIMPIAEFPGRFGWGYDGVDLFAPSHLYGTPDDLRAFVDRAHALGLGVILDVVYNHLGPDGNYVKAFSDSYFTGRYENEWGEAINFDGPGSGPVREFFISNAGYWIDEFHLDGLRLDATQQIYDSSPTHVIVEIQRRARQSANGRKIILVAENEPQHTRLVRPEAQGGYGIDALWNDDFHHSAVPALTGHNDAYYTDTPGNPQEFISALKYGYLFQGQRYKWQKNPRGTPALDIEPQRFVLFIENHDQVANSGRGERLSQLTSPGRLKAMTALMLLAPGTPLLFQGQEFASSSPFLYFADHKPELAKKVDEGRKEFLTQFRNLATPEMQACVRQPRDPKTFELCKLDFSEREKHAAIYRLHCDLLRLRREDPVFSAQRARSLDGAVLGPRSFVIRFFAEDSNDRLLLVNLGGDLRLDVMPEPLLAPPLHRRWQMLWSSDSSQYGGCGTPPIENEDGWLVPGEAALVLHPVAADAPPR